MTTTRRVALPRLLIGIVISAAFLALVIARVNLGEVAAAVRGANLTLLAIALIVVLGVDLFIRAARWRVLLAAILPDPPGIPRAAAWLSIGYMANTILPARLGDVARAYLAGSSFGAARLATLGTVLVERVSDGLMMVALLLVSSVLVAGFGQVRDLQTQSVIIMLLVIVGFVGLGAAWLVLTRGPLARIRSATMLRHLLNRMAIGAAALGSLRGAALVAGLTIAAATTASLVSGLVTSSLGLALTPVEVVLFTSGIALSLAIPTAPGNLGTLEFAGVLILTAFGASAEVGLAAILLVRLVTTIPLALMGVVVTVATDMRPSAMFSVASAEGSTDAGVTT